jgi:hypothetical protein
MGSFDGYPQTPTAVQQLLEVQSALLWHTHPGPTVPDADGVQSGAAQVRQHEPLPGVVPSGQVPSWRIWQSLAFSMQSPAVLQAMVGSFEQVPAVDPARMSQLGMQVEKPVFPHVERAAHRVTLPLQFLGRRPQELSALVTCAIQLTYLP